MSDTIRKRHKGHQEDEDGSTSKRRRISSGCTQHLVASSFAPDIPSFPSSPSLPDEILEKILSLLPLNDLCRARRVCTAWDRVAFRCDSWKAVDAGRHWRQDLNPTPELLTKLKKLRSLRFTSKFGYRHVPRVRVDPSSNNSFVYPRGPDLVKLTSDLECITVGNPILKVVNTISAGISGCVSDVENSERRLDTAFRRINELETLAVDTRHLGFPLVPALARMTWANTLKRLCLVLGPEQGALTHHRPDLNLRGEVASRTNRFTVGSLKPLPQLCSLTSFELELSFDNVDATLVPHFFDPIKKCEKLRELKLGLVSLFHVFKYWGGRAFSDAADRKLNDALDSFFAPKKDEISNSLERLEVFHLVNLEGPSLGDSVHPQALTLRLTTLSLLLSAVERVRDLCLTGFHFPLPANPQGAENPFVHVPSTLEELRFLNHMEKYNDQSLLQVGLVTALNQLPNIHRLECELPPLCWYGLQPIVKKLRGLEIFGLGLSLVTSFLLVIDNIETLTIHAELILSAVEILQLAIYHLRSLRRFTLCDSNNPTPALRHSPKILAQIFANGHWVRLSALCLDVYDFIPEALRNISASCSNLAELKVFASHANNFFGHSLEVDAEAKAIEAFESLGNLGGTLEECRIDVSSRFLFDEADWPSEKLRKVFPRPKESFERLKKLLFIYRCQHGNFCFSIVEPWQGGLVRTIDFWDDSGEISHYLPATTDDADAAWSWSGTSIAAFREKTRSMVEFENGQWMYDDNPEDDLAEEWENDAEEEVEELDSGESEDDFDAPEEIEPVDEIVAVDELDHAPIEGVDDDAQSAD